MDKVLKKDADAYDVMTDAMRALLNKFPLLAADEIVKFEEIGEDSGIAFTADAGALVLTEKRCITGDVHQECQYPFLIIYRTAATKERQKLNVKNFLDSFGRWLTKQPVEIGDKTEQLDSYPALSGGMKIKRITRDNSYATKPQDSGVQDWLLPVVVSYTNDFED